MASGAVLEIATLGGYSIGLGFHEAAGLGLLTHGCSYAIDQSKDIEFQQNVNNISSALSNLVGYYAYDVLNKKNTKDKENDKQKKGTPRPNNKQNDQARDAKKEIEKNIGRKLTQDEKRQFHDYIIG